MLSKSSGLLWFVLVLWDPEKWPRTSEQLFPRSFPRHSGHNKGWFVLTWIFSFYFRSSICSHLEKLQQLGVIPKFRREWRHCPSPPKHCPNREVVQSQSSNSCFSPATPGSCHQMYPGTATAKSHGMGSIFSLIFKELSSAAPFSLLTLHSPSPPHPQRWQRQEWQGQQC